MANTAFTSTEGAQFNLDIWANEVLRFYTRKLIFSQVFTDLSGRAKNVRGFKTLELPTTRLLYNSTTTVYGEARAKSEGNDGNDITYDKNTDTKVTLTIDQHYYQAFEVEEFEDTISGYDIQAEYTKAVAEAIARMMDATKAALVDNFSQTVGTLTEDLTEDDLLYAVQLLDDGDVPTENRAWVVSNACWAGLMKMNKLTSIDYQERKPLVDGEIRNLLGYPCYKCNDIEGSNAAGHDNGLIQKDAAGYVTAMRPKTRVFDEINNLSTQVAMSAIWGDKELRDGNGIWVKGP